MPRSCKITDHAPFPSVWHLVKWTVRNIVGTTLEPIPLPSEPKYRPSTDVSLIVPTIGFDKDLIISLRSWLSNHPKEIIIVTSEKFLDALIELVHGALSVEERKIVQTLSCPLANKRKQLVTGFRRQLARSLYSLMMTSSGHRPSSRTCSQVSRPTQALVQWVVSTEPADKTLPLLQTSMAGRLLLQEDSGFVKSTCPPQSVSTVVSRASLDEQPLTGRL